MTCRSVLLCVPAFFACAALQLSAAGCDCGGKKGERWAKKTFGEEESLALQQEATGLAWRAWQPGAGENEEQEPWAERPLVVFSKVPQTGEGIRLEYHRANDELGEATSAKDVRTLILVSYEQSWNKGETFYVKRQKYTDWENEPFMQLTIINRSTKTSMQDWVRGHEDQALVEAVRNLRSAP